MISPKDITVVLQGDIRSGIDEVINSIRLSIPGAHLILSTFTTEKISSLSLLVDELILSNDPGALPAYTKSDSAPSNNINRQIISTQAGLATVATPYAIKLRTDCQLIGDDFLSLANELIKVDGNLEKIIASSFFTRHPKGISCYSFHVSDWFMFAQTKKLQDFWQVEPMTDLDASFFERNKMQGKVTKAASRFRARFTPEQHLCVQYARKLGYVTPRYLNESNSEIDCENINFITKNFLIAEPEILGVRLEKYEKFCQSLYMKIDCISFWDWCKLLQEQESYSLMLTPMGKFYIFKSILTSYLRQLLHPFRYSINWIVVSFKSSKRN